MHFSLINTGITNDLSFRQKRVLQIVNAVSIILGLLLPIAAFFNFQQNEMVNALAILAIAACYFLNLLWNSMRLYLLSKVVVCYGITVIPFLNLILNGRIPDGQFLSLTTIAIVFSIASIILFDHKDEKFFYYFSIFFYILWISFIDIVIIQLSGTEPIDFISEYYSYYKIPPILGLVALSIMVTFFKNIIFKYEAENEAIKVKLKHKNQELEERVEERTTELSKTMERVINIAFLTSHELRAPLAAIMGTTRLLKELPDDDEAVSELLPQLHAKSEEMDHAIRKMNDVLQETVENAN